LAGIAVIRALTEAAGDRIIVMPGGGINEETIATIVQQSAVREVHLSARGVVESTMRFRNERVNMGLPNLPEYQRKTTDADRVRTVVQLLNK
jgi:copper homeostasis protein